MKINSDSDFFLTRSEFAARAGISVSELRRQEALGNIVPARRNRQNQPFYKNSQLQEFLKSRGVKTSPLLGDKVVPYTSEEASVVFRELEKGQDTIAIVETMKIHPRAVRAIAADYAELKGAIILNPHTIAKINILPLDGNFPLQTEEDVYDVLLTCSREKCVLCKKKPKSTCKQCAIVMARRLEMLDQE